MVALGRELASLLLRRGPRSRPVLQTRAGLPLRFVNPSRGVSVSAPGSRAATPAEGDDHQGDSVIAAPPPEASSSQHPFAASDQYALSSSSSASSSSPSGSSQTTVTSLPPPPQSPRPPPPPHLRHPFDTHAFVSYLEKHDIEPNRARTLMEATRQLIVHRSDQARLEMLGKEDMENAAYLFRAALSELRTELSVRSRNDGAALRAMTTAISREVDILDQKVREDIQTLRHDIEMDMNNRKAENRSDQKSLDIDIEEINNKFTISLGDLRTEIESAKWDATRRAITIIALIVVAGVAVTMFNPTPAPTAVPPPRPASTGSASSGGSTIRDMAVGTDDDMLDENGVTIPEDVLDKVLKESGVSGVQSRKKPKPRKEELFVDRI